MSYSLQGRSPDCIRRLNCIAGLFLNIYHVKLKGPNKLFQIQGAIVKHNFGALVLELGPRPNQTSLTETFVSKEFNLCLFVFAIF